MKGSDPLAFKFFMAGGFFSIICAIFDVEFFMGHHKAAFLVKILGRNGARVFYVILGLLLVGAGAYGLKLI